MDDDGPLTIIAARPLVDRNSRSVSGGIAGGNRIVLSRIVLDRSVHWRGPSWERILRNGASPRSVPLFQSMGTLRAGPESPRREASVAGGALFRRLVAGEDAAPAVVAIPEP